MAFCLRKVRAVCISYSICKATHNVLPTTGCQDTSECVSALARRHSSHPQWRAVKPSIEDYSHLALYGRPSLSAKHLVSTSIDSKSMVSELINHDPHYILLQSQLQGLRRRSIGNRVNLAFQEISQHAHQSISVTRPLLHPSVSCLSTSLLSRVPDLHCNSSLLYSRLNTGRILANGGKSQDLVTCAKVNAAGGGIDPARGGAPLGDENSDLPTQEQLQHVHNVLLYDLPNMFNKKMDYKIYSKNIIFDNRIKGTYTEGITMYITQLSLLKLVAHIRFSFVKLHILGISKHPDEGTIKVRWRIKAVTTFQALVHYLRTKKWGSPSDSADISNWYDGYSTFYVNTEGTVDRHVVDNMMRDETPKEEKVPKGLAAKLALFIGLLPKERTAELGSFM